MNGGIILKGTVVGTWVKTLSRMYPEDIVKEKMKVAGMDPNKAISPLDDIEDFNVYIIIWELFLCYVVLVAIIYCDTLDKNF